DPKLAKGLVRREVVETVTPGTVLSDDWLARNRNNYLVALDSRGPAVGIAALDVTTGELVLEVVPPPDLEAVLARYEAAELVVPAGTRAPRSPAAILTEREAWEFDPELAREDLTLTFALASLDGLGIAADHRSAMGAGASACARPWTVCATWSAWPAAPPSGAPPRVSWVPCAIRSGGSLTCAAR